MTAKAIPGMKLDVTSWRNEAILVHIYHYHTTSDTSTCIDPSQESGSEEESLIRRFDFTSRLGCHPRNVSFQRG